ncbi:MAG: type II secretion system F family protein [bacterium]|nr:type II secretion system F family protein [bacterium]
MNKFLAFIKSDIQEKFKALSSKQLFLRLSLKSQILFIKQLAILMRAGVPLLSSLYMLKKQSRSRAMIKIMEQMIKDVENGQYLATAMGKFKKSFGELTINIIAVGEISGTLSNNLDHLAVALKKRQALRRKVIGASVYPVLIIAATLGITVMLTVFVFPKIVPVFQSINYELPWTTKFLIFLSNSAKNYGLFIGLGALAAMIALFFLLKIKRVHYYYDTILVRIPFIKKMIQMYNTANICRTLGLLLNSGVTVVRGFHITSNTTVNLAYKKGLDDIAGKITEGEIISANMNKSPALFPLAVSQMIEVGESTGKLSETFTYLADIHEEEMDDLTRNLSTTIEPMLLIFMGVLVGFIAISIITPIYGITQHLTPR